MTNNLLEVDRGREKGTKEDSLVSSLNASKEDGSIH